MSETTFYTSQHGDRWVLIKNERAPVVEHRPNAASGGRVTQVSVADFLSVGNSGPEHQMLRSMQDEASSDASAASATAAAGGRRPSYVARFSYDFQPVDRDKAMAFIRRSCRTPGTPV